MTGIRSDLSVSKIVSMSKYRLFDISYRTRLALDRDPWHPSSLYAGRFHQTIHIVLDKRCLSQVYL